MNYFWNESENENESENDCTKDYPIGCKIDYEMGYMNENENENENENGTGNESGGTLEDAGEFDFAFGTCENESENEISLVCDRDFDVGREVYGQVYEFGSLS